MASLDEVCLWLWLCALGICSEGGDCWGGLSSAAFRRERVRRRVFRSWATRVSVPVETEGDCEEDSVGIDIKSPSGEEEGSAVESSGGGVGGVRNGMFGEDSEASGRVGVGERMVVVDVVEVVCGRSSSVEDRPGNGFRLDGARGAAFGGTCGELMHGEGVLFVRIVCPGEGDVGFRWEVPKVANITKPKRACQVRNCPFSC